jgi:hypothetical protein
MEVINILGYSALALLFTKYFTPIQQPKAWVVDKLVTLVIRTKQYWAMELVKILTCPKCFSFWFTLVYTCNLWYAAVASILAMIINLTIQKLEDGSFNER